jgi:hypothetical protein
VTRPQRACSPIWEQWKCIGDARCGGEQRQINSWTAFSARARCDTWLCRPPLHLHHPPSLSHPPSSAERVQNFISFSGPAQRWRTKTRPPSSGCVWQSPGTARVTLSTALFRNRAASASASEPKILTPCPAPPPLLLLLPLEAGGPSRRRCRCRRKAVTMPMTVRRCARRGCPNHAERTVARS